MIIKDGAQVQDTALIRPSGSQQAWLDVPSDTAGELQRMGETLGLDAKIIDEIRLDGERAQLQDRDELLLMLIFIPEDEHLKPMFLILGPNLLITVHRDPITLVSDLAKEVAKKAELFDSPAYLLYEVLERAADLYLERLDVADARFDDLEETVLNGQDRAREIFALRHELHRSRQVLADLRRMAARLSRRKFASEGGEPNLFVDVYEGFYHVMDNIDSLRDNLTGLVDLQLNQRSTRLNEIMKFLTIFSTIFLPLSFITGFLGMNLHPMPELTAPYSQEFTMALMGIVVLSMLYIFKRRKWM